MAKRGHRWRAWFLPLAVVPLAASCAAQRAALSLPSSPNDPSVGIQTMGHPVGGLDLMAMVPPGGAALMRAPVHGTGPLKQDYGNLGPVAGKRDHRGRLCLRRAQQFGPSYQGRGTADLGASAGVRVLRSSDLRASMLAG